VARSLDDAQAKARSTSEVDEALAWRKSTRSIANGQCVEAAALADGRLVVRDSVNKCGPVATFTVNNWRAFIKEIKDADLGLI
jgi:Domain of unknown function (DUF397)